jgi:hypothetical protein
MTWNLFFSWVNFYDDWNESNIFFPQEKAVNFLDPEKVLSSFKFIPNFGINLFAMQRGRKSNLFLHSYIRRGKNTYYLISGKLPVYFI